MRPKISQIGQAMPEKLSKMWFLCDLLTQKVAVKLNFCQKILTLYKNRYLKASDQKLAKSDKLNPRNSQNGDFSAIFADIAEKQEFSVNDRIHHFYGPPCPLTSCKKSEKSNEAFSRKVRKTSILVHFDHIWACPRRAIFFLKIGRRHKLDLMAIDHHTKN